MSEYKNIKLKEFKKIIDKAVKRAGETDSHIEFYYNDNEIALDNIGQFSILPDVVIEFISIKKYESKKPPAGKGE